MKIALNHPLKPFTLAHLVHWNDCLRIFLLINSIDDEFCFAKWFTILRQMIAFSMHIWIKLIENRCKLKRCKLQHSVLVLQLLGRFLLAAYHHCLSFSLSLSLDFLCTFSISDFSSINASFSIQPRLFFFFVFIIANVSIFFFVCVRLLSKLLYFLCIFHHQLIIGRLFFSSSLQHFAFYHYY